MKPEIKQRIEQIRRGEIPAGYKKTKVGIIPDSWKISRIEDFCQMKSGNTITASEFDNNAEYPCYGGNGLRGYTSHYTHEGTHVLIGRQGALCGNVKFVKGKFFASEHAIVVTTKENSLMLFCFYLFEYLNLNKYSESSAQPGLSVEKILRIFTALPSISEQRKIVAILSTQDKVIELYEKKIEQLQLLKKVCLQKMFPKQGRNVPEVRFPGFTEPWEQRKLSEYLVTSIEKNTDGHYKKEDVLSVSGDFGVVNQIAFQGRSYAGVSVSNYGILHTHDIVYTKSPLKANPYGIIKTNKGKTGIVSTLYAIYHPIQRFTNSDFVQCYFELDERLNSYLHPLVNKGAKNDMKVADDNVLKGNVLFPSLLEQCTISMFFSKLNDLITLHLRRLDEENRKKKALMQLLLTGIVRV